MAIFVLLPILALLLIFCVFPSKGYCWRLRALNTAVVWGVIVALSTEGLSAFGILTRGWVSAVWVAIVLVILGLLGWQTLKEGQAQRPVAKSNDPIPMAYRLAIWSMGIVVALTGFVAFIAPPNNWDSMAYHMARVAHWIQNGTVRHYPTVYLPQLYHPPWAEFAITHLQILSDSDRFANGIQCLSMVGSVLGVSLIAKLLGADCRAQVFASVLAATIPMGILQASSTQNDFVVAFWLVCFVAYTLRIATNRSEQELQGVVAWEPVLGAGASLGLALLTKGTAYIYSAPFVVWLMLTMVKRGPWRALVAGLVMGSLVLLLNGGHFLRNSQLFGSPLTSGGESYMNEVYTPAVFVSNVMRSISLQIGTPFEIINTAEEKAVLRLHDALGIAANDPRTTAWMGGEFKIQRMNTLEDSAGNPIHAAIIIVSIAAFVFHKSLRAQQHVIGYLVSVCVTFMLFNVLLKWQPWHSRLHLPLFVLFAPFVAIVLSQWRMRLVPYIMTFLLVGSSPWVLANQTRSLIPVFKQHKSILVESRLDQYFERAGRSLKEPYLGAAAFLQERNLQDMGLMLPYNPFEYQLWVILKQGRTDIRLEHTEVENVSSATTPLDSSMKFLPEAIIRVQRKNEQPRAELRMGARVYTRAWSLDSVGVYVLEP
jgi:hypothetical protein